VPLFFSSKRRMASRPNRKPPKQTREKREDGICRIRVAGVPDFSLTYWRPDTAGLGFERCTGV
jgi:hypothetical protein